jgi:hypothetical protein
MRRLLVLAATAWLCASALATAAPPAIRGIGVDETLDRDAVLALALDRARLAGSSLPVFVRLLVGRADLLSSGSPATTDYSRLDARLDLYARRQIPVVLTFVDPPADTAGIDAWRAPLRALVTRVRGKVRAYQVGDRMDGLARPSAKDYGYLLRFVAVQVRSIDAEALVVQGGIAAIDEWPVWQEQVYREDVAAHVDMLALPASPGDDRARVDGALGAIDTLAVKEDPSVAIGVTGMALAADSRQATEQLLGWYLAHLGGRVTFATCVAGADTLASVLKSAAALKDILAGEVVALDERASSLALAIGGQDVTATVTHRLLYNNTTFATYLAYWAPDRTGERLEVRLRLAAAGTPVVRDAVSATTLQAADAARDDATKTSTARVALTGRPALVDFNFGAEEVYALRSEASGKATPTVDEIIFRHQQADAAQAEIVRNYIANARVEIHFQPTALDAYDIVVENRFFSDPDTTEWQELTFSLNGAKWGRNRPPFPLLQPEKVLSLPLALRLNRDYVYRLEGTDRVGDRPCYVVRFDPIDEKQSLYRGRVWIDTERYVRLKVQSVQTSLSPPVVSNEEVQTFTAVGQVGDRPVYLFSRMVSQQIVAIAGRNLLVTRNVDFTAFRVNEPGFAEERQRARQTDDIMYRDTDKGLRHLVKQGNERVVSNTVKNTGKALALGTIVDPSYDYPLPLLGIDYVNFNLLNRGLQLGFIFSGVLAAGNLQKAKIGGSKFDASLDFYGIAVNSNDLVYDEDGERSGERLLTRNVSTGVNLGYQATDYQKVTLGSHAQYDHYSAETDYTSPDFVVPADTVTVNGGFNYEYRRGGYSLLGSWAYFWRADWEPWGNVDDYDPATRTYTKYDVGLSKDFHFKPIHTIRLNGNYYGGQRLDRFSMYRFGLFDPTRMRGIPAAGVRFSEVGMVRASYSFNLLNRYRLALYADHAWGRTPEEREWVPTTGVGVEANFPGPKTTMLKVGVGKGFLPDIYKGSGSFVFEFMLFKPI